MKGVFWRNKGWTEDKSIYQKPNLLTYGEYGVEYPK